MIAFKTTLTQLTLRCHPET